MLALWEYFWTWNGVAPPVVTPDPTTEPRGSGKGHHNKHDYQALSEEYWQEHATKYKAPEPPLAETITEREQRLLFETQQIILEQQQLAGMQAELVAVQGALRSAASVDELKTFTQHIANLQTQIAKLEATNKARIIRAKSLRFSLYH